MNTVIELKVLLNKLSNEELKILRKMLVSKGDTLHTESKSLLLLELLQSPNHFSSLEIQQTLYTGKNYSAFNKLCNRMKEKILDSMLIENSILNGGYSKRNEILFSLKKKIIQADILSLKGLREEADSLIKKVIQIANDFELYEISIQGLQIREKFIRIRKNQKEIKKLNEEMILNDQKLNSFRSCQSQFNLMMSTIANVSSKVNYSEQLKLIVDELKQQYRKFGSSTTNYYLLLLETEYLQIKNRYGLADKCLDQAVKAVEKKSVFSENRMGSVLLSKSDNYIHMYDFENSNKYLKLAEKYFQNNVFNKALVNENRFYSKFYGGDYKESRDILNSLLRLPVANNTYASLNRYKYFNAILLFIENNFLECLSCLKELNEIEKDKEGWNINIRILQILTLIEIQNFEEAELQISNLIKFMNRISKKSKVEKRYVLISRILNHMSNLSFDPNFQSQKLNQYISKIDFVSGDEKWKIKSPEIIPFEDWFFSKRKKSEQLYSKIVSKFN